MRISSFSRRRASIGRHLFATAVLVITLVTVSSRRLPALADSTTAPASTLPAAASPTSAATRQPILAVRPEPLKSTEYRLAYKFRVSEDVHMPLFTDSQILVQKGPASQSTSSQSTVDRHYHVTSIDPDGSAVVELFIDSVKLSYAFNNGNPTTYDTSTLKPAPPGFEKVRDSVGPHGHLRFSPQGVLLALPGAAPNAVDSSESFLDILPAKSVHIGDEWSDDMKVKVSVSRTLNQKVTLRRRYTLESVNGNIATIRLRTVEITPIHDPQIQAQLVQRTPEGTITFDLDRGIVTARDLTCERKVVGIMEGGGMIAATTHIKGSLR
jgi:Family of unknown function (DUF6263)